MRKKKAPDAKLQTGEGVKTLVIHKSYQPPKKAGERGSAELHVFDGQKAVKLEGPKLDKWLARLEPHHVRSTFAGCDMILISLKERGSKVLYAPWAKCGLAKGAKVEEILAAFWSMPASEFYEFSPRKDIFNLRRVVDMRELVIDLRKRSAQQIEAIERMLGPNPVTERMKVDQDADRKASEGLLEKQVAQEAEKIAECRLFNAIAGIGDGWNSAAKLVAYSGGLERFHSVSAFWKFCGLDVRDGKAPKRKMGEHGGWSPRLRTACWQLGDSIYKNRANPWRAVYERNRAAEFAEHDAKCGCKHKDGHSTNRAKRKMVKELLKKFFLACCHHSSEIQRPSAARQEGEIGDGHPTADTHGYSAIPENGSQWGHRSAETRVALAPLRAQE